MPRKTIKSKSARSAAARAAEKTESPREAARLRRELSDCVRELSGAREMVAHNERMAGLGRAVATVTHELRNPLGIMRTWLHVLEQKAPQDNPDLSRPLDRIKRGITQCVRIIDDVLDFARGYDHNPEPTRFDNWLHALIDEQFPPDGVTVEFRPGLADRRVSIDRGRLRRTLVNLIENAFHAVTGGGESGVVTVSTTPAGESIEVRVTDTGPGVPEELRRRIFTPLFSTRASGIGLGLAVVRQIVEQHGGTVQVEDRSGEGASFLLLLPATEPPRKA